MITMLDNAKMVIPPERFEALKWDGDNRHFIVEDLLPRMVMRQATRQVIRWAYGYDGEGKSWEMESDGSTLVPDMFMGGLVKEPYGVGHDYLCRLLRKGVRTPDGHLWTWAEAAAWYRDAVTDFGFPFRAWWRWFGLRVAGIWEHK